MRYVKHLSLTIIAIILLSTAFATSASAQRGRHGTKQRVIVYVNPFYNSWYDPFYDPYYYNPYYRERRNRYYLEQELRGNERELAKHREKYNRDGVITAKERRELDDDIKDVANSRATLQRLYGRYD
jgi:hypothetical protein